MSPSLPGFHFTLSFLLHACIHCQHCQSSVSFILLQANSNTAHSADFGVLDFIALAFRLETQTSHWVTFLLTTHPEGNRGVSRTARGIMSVLRTVPKKDGYRMPGEFEPHRGCYMLWPMRPDNWRDEARPAQRAFAQVAAAIQQFEPVTVGVCSAGLECARAALPPTVRIVELESDDAWMRDVGPTFVTDRPLGSATCGAIRGVDWRFNSWGGHVDGLYWPWDLDDAVARQVCAIEDCPCYSLTDFILEGGSIHTDGDGTVYTTEECLLSAGRNPNLSKAEIEQKLLDYLGADKVIWLKKGIVDDETNGHVDNILNVVAPGVVVLAWCDNPSDPQHAICEENMSILRGTKDAKGRRIDVHCLLVPREPLRTTPEETSGVKSADHTLPRRSGDRLAGSYANYYAANGGIVYPMLGDHDRDHAAGEVLKTLYPDRKVVGVPTREILLGGGNIHCITQQVPL